MLLDELFSRLLRELLFADGLRNVRRHQDQPLCVAALLDAFRSEHATVRQVLKEPLCCRVALILLVQLSVRDEQAHRALVAVKSLVHVERVPGAHGLVLGDALDELPGRADGVHVHLARIPVTQVPEAERECTPDDRVDQVVPAGSDRRPRIESKLIDNRPVDDQERRLRACGHEQRLAALPAYVRDRFHRCDHDRKVLRLRPRHDCVDGDLLNGGDTEARRHVTHDVVRRKIRALEHRLYRFPRRRVERQSVAKVFANEILVHLEDGVVPVFALVAPGAFGVDARLAGVDRRDQRGDEFVDRVRRLAPAQVVLKVAVDSRHDDPLEVWHAEGPGARNCVLHEPA